MKPRYTQVASHKRFASVYDTSMTLLLIACGAVMLASLSGKLLVWRSAGAFIERNLHVMVSFAAGVFLLFAGQLGVEVFEHMEVVAGILWIIGGGVIITLACTWLPHSHTAREEEHEHEHPHPHDHPHLDAHRMLISDSIHNVGDGILLAATFSVSPVFGIAAATSVFLHEVVQEIAEFFVLRDAGYSTNRALWLNFLTSTTILAGAIGGWFVLELFEEVEGILLAIATGGVLSVVFYDLLPHSLRHARERSLVWKHLGWFVAGAIVMYGVITLVPHEDPGHEEELRQEIAALILY